MKPPGKSRITTKPHLRLTIAAFVLLGLTIPFCAKADPSPQVSASVEIFELTQPLAVAVQKVFTAGTDIERTNLLSNVRKATAANGVKTIAVGQRTCRIGQPSEVNSTTGYQFPVEFEPRGDFAYPTAFETRTIGCTMAMTVSAGGKEGAYSVETDFHDIVVSGTAHYQASKADQRGSWAIPKFTTHQIKTQIDLTAGVPKLVGAYTPAETDSNDAPARYGLDNSPAKNDPPNNVRRMVFVTVEPEK
jgi:hypothetical protein